MADLLHLRPEDARRVPWKNGRGVTQELALWPPGSSFERGDFDVRISASSVDEPGPFSPFPGFRRVLVVTRGAGLRLSHGADAPGAELTRLRPHAFEGEWPTTAELPYGPVDDFNVIVRRGRMRVDVDVVPLGAAGVLGPFCAAPGTDASAAPPCADVFAHVAEGHALLGLPGHRSPIAVGPRESLLLRNASPAARLELLPASTADAVSGIVLLVRLAPA